MGVENNECIVATTWNDDIVWEIREWVDCDVPREFRPLFAFVESVVNGKTTIIMAPDGSKKVWDTANEGDKIRAAFIEKLESYNYSDGSSPFDWVEVGYGEYGQKVLRGNCKNCYTDEEYGGPQ